MESGVRPSSPPFWTSDGIVKEGVKPWHAALSFTGAHQASLPQFPPQHSG